MAGNGGTNAVVQGQPGAGAGLVMPGFPMRGAAVPHYSPYSPSRFHIDKRCQHRCTWKCFSIAMILVVVALSAMLAYFAGESSCMNYLLYVYGRSDLFGCCMSLKAMYAVMR